MLLESQETFRIVKSDRISFLQHNPFSWLVKDHDFCYIDHLTPDARYLDKTLNEWIYSLSKKQRERFIDTIYEILNTTKPETLTELRSDWPRNIPAMVQAALQTDQDTREFLFQTLKGLASLGIKNIPEIFRDGREK